MPASGRTATLRSKISGRPPTSGSRNATSDVIATRGERLVLIRSRLSRSDEELESFHVDLLWVVEIGLDDRIAALGHVRPERLRGRHRRARRALSRRRSGRPRAHLVGDHGWPRHGQPARIAPHDTGLREHRPPAGHIIRARRTRPNTSVLGSSSTKTSEPTSRLCIGSATLELCVPMQGKVFRTKASMPSGAVWTS